jgi:hypothetical protein
VLVEPPLIVQRVLREQIGMLHRRLRAVVRNDDVCRRLMTTPGVGPVVALTYRATDDHAHAKAFEGDDCVPTVSITIRRCTPLSEARARIRLQFKCRWLAV